jgi:hypothetical protein
MLDAYFGGYNVVYYAGNAYVVDKADPDYNGGHH